MSIDITPLALIAAQLHLFGIVDLLLGWMAAMEQMLAREILRIDPSTYYNASRGYSAPRLSEQ
ncbi:hypothetical protein DVG80_32340 [Rhodococcus erythropolis]|nr:hypothetical protein DVG80_32340 [Rhodococcus erythropolis]